MKDTKFDIRLWYLVTCTFPLTIWLFKYDSPRIKIHAFLREIRKDTRFDHANIRLEIFNVCSFALHDHVRSFSIRRDPLFRFSSKPYTFSTYHEAIHICNTAVQEKYDDEKRRRRRKQGNVSISSSTENAESKSLRDQGWNCEKLNEYLK